MKKILILFVVLLSATFFAQTPNWTGVKETNINVSNAYWFHDGVDIFTNRDGNHIIVQESNNLKYYKMNLNGVAGSPISIEYSTVVSPSISGNSDNIYIVYGIGSQVRVQRSIDGGANWSLWLSFNLSTSASDMESVFSNDNLHVTYRESGVVKYRFRNALGGPWNGPFTVSTDETGTSPRITARYNGEDNDYVYFVWQKQGTHIVNWRKFEVTGNNWGDKEYGYQVYAPNLLSSNFIGFNVTSSTIVFYYYYETDEPGKESTARKFRWLWKDLNNNYLGTSAPDEYHWHVNKIYSTTTRDSKSHVVYYLQEGATKLFDIWRSNSINGYWDDNVYDYDDYSDPPFWQDGPRYINNSSAGNEVHVIWKDAFGNNGGNNLRYKWDNQNPIAPQHLTITSHNNHPKLVWQKNPEQDIDYYRIYRKKGTGDYELHTTVSASLPTEYVDNEETVCSVPPGAHCDNEVVAKYKITAIDLTSKESDYSNEVEAILQGDPQSKISAGNSPGEIYSYELSQNFPNPFNPTTSINYQIKEKGFVSLKVFDMLGNEVAILVNETQDEGQYSVIFDASNLPSGVYIYSLRVNDFVQNNKMTLLK